MISVGSSAHLFFQLVARRYERSRLLLTTNQVVTQWAAVFADELPAAAILDRVLHHSRTITISGDSYRLEQKRKAGFFGSATQETRARGPAQEGVSFRVARGSRVPIA